MSIDVSNPHYYYHISIEHDNRTLSRLNRINDAGLSVVGIEEFGYPGITSGLYIERVWNYSDAEFDDYMTWMIDLIKEKT